MGTLFDDIIKGFLIKVEKDRKFFSYYKLTDGESLELVKQRSMNYLDEAIIIFRFKAFSDFDLFKKNEENSGFANELTDDEIYLLTNLMYEIHLKRDLMDLKAMSERYAPVDLKVFSPANERKSFLELIKKIEMENVSLFDVYCVRDRETGTTKILK